MAKKDLHEEILLDKRVVKWNLLNGNIKDSDYQSYLKSLPDESSNVEEHIVWEESAPEGTGLTFSSITLENNK